MPIFNSQLTDKQNESTDNLTDENYQETNTDSFHKNIYRTTDSQNIADTRNQDGEHVILSEEQFIKLHFTNLLKAAKRLQSKKSHDLIFKAFQFAKLAHKGMKRKNNELYVLHTIAVAKIVVEYFDLGTRSIVAALLHHVVDCTDYMIDDLDNVFDKKTMYIIHGLSKIDNLLSDDKRKQAENIKHLLITMSQDIRVILIKLADRLHNMRTLDGLPLSIQVESARETLYLYAPLAHRLGLYSIKTELEDLSFKYLEPRTYDEIVRLIKDDERKRWHNLNRIALPIMRKLEDAGYQYEIKSRLKSVYSIWKKMQTKNVPFNEVYDLLAMRIIFEPKDYDYEAKECHKIMDFMQSIERPIFNIKEDRIRNWVDKPKSNGYTALHATFFVLNNWIEVQIRSARMNEIAEKGIAAHWKYKKAVEKSTHNDYIEKQKILENTENEADETHGEIKLLYFDSFVEKVRNELEDTATSDSEFLDNFRINFLTPDISAFTPKGKLIVMPQGATIIDFAFQIHTDLGYKCIGAKVNHRLVPIYQKLQNGDQVEILTSDKQKPTNKWLEIAVTPKAKTALKSYFAKLRRELIEKGVHLFDKKLCEIAPELRSSASVIRQIMQHFEETQKDEFFFKVGQKNIQLQDLATILQQKPESKMVKYWQISLSEEEKTDLSDTSEKHTTNRTERNFILANCCNPIPGDKILGYKSPDETIMIVHRSDCQTALQLKENSNFISEIEWQTQKRKSFLTALEISGVDSIGVVNDITTLISRELNVNMRSIHFDSVEERFDGYISLFIQNLNDLNALIHKLKRIHGINNVQRIMVK